MDNEYMVIGVATDAQFGKFCKVLGLENLTNDDRFSTNKVRCQNNSLFFKELQDVISNWHSDSLQTEFEQSGVPFSRINSISQLFATPEVKRMNLTDSV